MRSIVAVFFPVLVSCSLVAKAYTVGSYFDVKDQAGYTVVSQGTVVYNGNDTLVEHDEDPASAFNPKIYSNLIDIYTADDHKFICEITEQEQIEWAFGDTVDWLKASSSDNDHCKVTYWISGQGDQTSHVSTQVV